MNGVTMTAPEVDVPMEELTDEEMPPLAATDEEPEPPVPRRAWGSTSRWELFCWWSAL